MKLLALLVFCCISLASAASRSKRAAYDLPDGVELLVGAVRTSFVCSGDGYYADIENNCQIFHVCQTVTHADGNVETQQWSFMCGNQTIFNQATLTCSYPEDSVPCASARDFFYLNANIGAGPNVPFLTDQDVERANALTPSRQYGYQPPVVQPPRPQRPGGAFRG